MEEKRQTLALRVKKLKRALKTLEEVLREPYSVLIRDATIQRYEYTFELRARSKITSHFRILIFGSSLTDLQSQNPQASAASS